jgi:hypothetical protein
MNDVDPDDPDAPGVAVQAQVELLMWKRWDDPDFRHAMVHDFGDIAACVENAVKRVLASGGKGASAQ